MSAVARPAFDVEERISEELAGVQTLEELHIALGGIAANPTQRWTRTQVLHYLPEAFRSAAEHYFEGERLKPAAEQPPRPAPVDVPALEAVLSRIAALPLAGNSVDDAVTPRARLRSVQEILGEEDHPDADSATIRTSGPVSEMLLALREEIRAVERKAPKRYRLSDGRCTGSADGRFTYLFHWSSEPDLFAPGALRVGEEWFEARVGQQSPDSERCYELSVSQYLGPSVKSAVFKVDPTFLLRAVHDRLKGEDDQSEDGDVYAGRLLSSPRSSVDESAFHGDHGDLNQHQRRAVSIASTQELSYVWGPPGTGKTTTLGALVASLVGAGKRVLVLSPYNVAVDEAILAAVKRGGIPLQKVVRFGRIGSEVRKAGVDLDSHLEKLARENGTLELARQLLAVAEGAQPGEQRTPPATVRSCLDELGSILVRSGAARRDERSRSIGDALAVLRRAFRAPESQLVTGASVVGTTITLSVVSPLVHRAGYDHLLIDEASVLRSPEAVVACLMTKCPVTFFGDPKQLPAIVQERSPRTDNWLARNPFDLAGIGSPEDAHGSCVMLEEQHRMAPPIRSLVSGLFYGDRLTDGERAPRAGKLLIVDTSGTSARATSRMVRLSHSKENLVHRQVVAEVVRAVRRAEPEAKVLVVAPFVAQKRAFRREPNTSRLGEIRFETIHTSQGSEQDVVILDLVLTGGLRGGRSRMLDDSCNPHLANLLNVAASRAKRYLIVVGHLDFLSREYRGGLVERLLARASVLGETVKVPRDLRCAAAFDAALVKAAAS